MIATFAPSDTTLLGDLERVAAARAFFAHRSVGADLIDGIERLVARTPGAALDVVAVDSELPDRAFCHALLSDNGDPIAKLADLERMLARGIGQAARVVLFKLCYGDFRAGTDATQVFHAYTRAMRGIRGAYPGLAVLHFTVPLVAVSTGSGLRTTARALFGRPPSALVENDRREEFNELLRRVYHGTEPIFDLAALESTLPSGERVRHDLHGRAVAALAPAYTDDGGHLNASARVAIARRLIASIARLGDPA